MLGSFKATKLWLKLNPNVKCFSRWGRIISVLASSRLKRMCGGQQQVEGTFVNFCQAIQITNYIKLHSKHQGLEMAPRGFQHKSLKAIWQIDAFQGKRHRPFDLKTLHIKPSQWLWNTPKTYSISFPVTQNPQLLKSMKNLYMFFVTSRSKKNRHDSSIWSPDG